VGISLYAAAFLWILAYDTIYAHQDREDDILVGIRSTARHFGERTRPFLAVCYGGAVALLALAGWLAGMGPGSGRCCCCPPPCWPGRWRGWTSTTPPCA
jgi:4-hydroxybenzoate polyprenyltransferase